MLVLAIDTALEACSTGVFDTERGMLALQSVPMLRGHAEALMPQLAEVMNEAGVEFVDVDRIAVTVGPGSFTGLRVGVAAARGIAVATGRPAVGLTTLAAFAAPHIASDDSVPLISVIDARHQHVYMQLFGTNGRTIMQPRLVPLRDAVRAASAGPARVVGNAAQMILDAWPAGDPRPPVIDIAAAPSIEWVARLGAAAAHAVALPKPLYLRAPDAQPQDASRLPRR